VEKYVNEEQIYVKKSFFCFRLIMDRRPPIKLAEANFMQDLLAEFV